DSRHKRRNCRRISDIEGLMEDFATRRFLYLRGGLSEATGSAGANGDVSALASEFLGDSLAQAFTSRRDYSHAATEPQIHSISKFKAAILSRSEERRVGKECRSRVV